jgi:hypothetical protein
VSSGAHTHTSWELFPAALNNLIVRIASGYGQNMKLHGIQDIEYDYVNRSTIGSYKFSFAFYIFRVYI